jgi:hypothetical protein
MRGKDAPACGAAWARTTRISMGTCPRLRGLSPGFVGRLARESKRGFTPWKS